MTDELLQKATLSQPELRRKRVAELVFEGKGDVEIANEIGCHRVQVSRIKTDARTQDRIRFLLEQQDVTVDEVRATLVSHLRADSTDLFDEMGILDLETIRQRNLGHLIKKLKRTRRWEGRGEDKQPVDELEIELYSSQTAAAQICKMMGWEQMPAINDRDYARSGESALQTWLARAATAQGLTEPLEATPDNLRAAIEAMRPGAQDMPDLLAFLDQKEQSLARGQDSEAVS